MRRGLALLVLAVLAAGCSGSGDEPVALPTLTAAPSPTATVAPVPPQATAHTPQGADAFARYYFQQLNAAFVNTDPTLIRAVSSKACGTCELYAKGLEQEQKEGRRLIGTAFQVVNVAAAPVDNGRSFVEVFGTIPAKRQVDRQGRTVTSVPAQGRFHFTLTLVSAAAGWYVDDIRIESS